MGDLEAVLSTVRDRIAKYRGQGIGEQDTKAALIVPVLRALGWDAEDLEDIKLEYKRQPADNPVDYALVLLRQPRLFIEAKQLGSNLDDRKWAGQFLGYAMAAGVEWVALTDGDEYRLYNSHATVPVEEKLFRTIRVSDPATHPAARPWPCCRKASSRTTSSTSTGSPSSSIARFVTPSASCSQRSPTRRSSDLSTDECHPCRVRT
jgi:hypothetical protein